MLGEEKNIQRKYEKTRYNKNTKRISKKLKLKEYQKNYWEAKKSQSSN